MQACDSADVLPIHFICRHVAVGSVVTQVEVGEGGSEQHAQRERMLRSAIELQTQLKQSQQKLEALTQQLADTPSEAQDTHTSADPAMPDTLNVKGTILPGKPDAAAPTSALMDSLFGSDDDDVDAKASDSQAQVTKASAGKQQANSAAVAAQQHRQTTADAAQAAGRVAGVADRRAGTHAKQGNLAAADFSSDNSKDRAQRMSSAGPSQQLVDPAAPRRSISFSSSLRRRQVSSVQQRKDAFNAAADEAVMQVAAQRSTAGKQAAGVTASGPSLGAAAAKPEADESRPEAPGSSPHKATHGTSSGIDIHQTPMKPNGVVSAASVPNQEIRHMPSALPRQPSVTQDLPGGRVQSAAAPAAPAQTAGLVAQGSEEAPKVITRTSQAEPAPKLKTGSRLAASMAKLAASKRGPSDQPALTAAAAAPMQQSGDVQKNSAIPEDVKRALLAKVH